MSLGKRVNRLFNSLDMALVMTAGMLFSFDNEVDRPHNFPVTRSLAGCPRLFCNCLVMSCRGI